MSTTSLDSSMLGRHGGVLDSRGDLINNSVKGLQRISLYVLGEKAQMKVNMCVFKKVDLLLDNTEQRMYRSLQIFME